MPRPTASSIARQDEALRLREAGLTLVDIAARVGYASHGAATYAIRAAQMRRGAQITHYGQESADSLPRWAMRNFGIEVEHCGCSLDASARAIRAAGLRCVNNGYTHQVMTDWKTVHDGSCGNEAVSPILSGSDGFAQMKTVMKALTNAGGRVDRRCGLHVHLDMAGLTGEQIARFVALYVHHQADIDALLPPSRVGNYYARTVADSELQTIAEAFTTTGTTPARWAQDRRYKTINVMSFPKYGTIEIRQHQGTLNASKAKAWTLLLMAMVEVARLDRCDEVAFGTEFVNSVTRIVSRFPRVHARRLNERRRHNRDTTPATLPDYTFGAAPAAALVDVLAARVNGCDCDSCVAQAARTRLVNS